MAPASACLRESSALCFLSPLLRCKRSGQRGNALSAQPSAPSETGRHAQETDRDICLTFCQPKCCRNSGGTSDTKNACTSKHMFNQNLSSTYVQQPDTFKISYKTGDVSGFVGQDIFCLSNTTLCATDQIFGQVTTVAGGFNKQPEDGMIGVGWPALSIDSVTPRMSNLLNQSKLDMPYFVVYMRHLGMHSENDGGQLSVGGLDTEHCSGTYDKIPLTSKIYWQFKMSRTNAKWREALGSYLVECGGHDPDVVFGINGNNYSVTQKNYTISTGTGLCMFGFFPSAGGGFYPSWLLGPPLIREYCQIHDMRDGTIGMAKVI